jgi:hypothetical protein
MVKGRKFTVDSALQAIFRVSNLVSLVELL